MKCELTALHALALEAGISSQWVDAFGVTQEVIELLRPGKAGHALGLFGGTAPAP